MPSRRLPLLFSSSLLLVSASLAQVTQADNLAQAALHAPQRVPIHTAPADHGIAYGVWAAGNSYKVSFHDGMTFVPYLGREYPHNQPWSWRTASLRVGATELVAPQPESWHDDYRYEYRFGGFTEAYDVRGDGVEQTFVFTSLPNAGDIVVSGKLTSGLRCEAAVSGHRGVTFVDADRAPILSYGAATAIDGAGRKLPLTTHCEGDQITLTVPDAWLQAATLPVVIDPIIATSPIVVGAIATGPYEADIAWEDESPTSNLMLAYTNFASANDADLRAFLCNDDYSNAAAIFVDVTTFWSTPEVSCAYVGGADRWAVVFPRAFVNTIPVRSELRVHVHDRQTPTLQTGYAGMMAPLGHNDWRPDVGGSASNVLGDKALVVFQREDNQATGNGFANTGNSEVHGVMIDVGLTWGSFGPSFPIQGNLLIDCEHPSVNQVSEGGTDYSWICALQTFNNWTAGDDWDVWAWRIGNDATKATGWFQPDIGASNGFHQFRPIVEGNHGRYAVVFATTDVATSPGKPLDTAGKHVRVERFNWAQGAADPDPTADYPTVMLALSGPREMHATGLAYDVIDRSHWVACFHYDQQNLIRYARVGFGGSTTELHDVATLGYPVAMTPCTFNDDFLTVHIAYNFSSLGTGLSCATLAYPTETVWSTSGTGCTTAGYIGWSGNQQIGSEFSQPSYSWATPTAVHVMAVSMGAVSLPVSVPGIAPGCSVLIDPTAPNFLGTMPVAVGQFVAWPLPLPEGLPVMTLYFQNWILDGGVLTSSERMRVPLVK